MSQPPQNPEDQQRPGQPREWSQPYPNEPAGPYGGQQPPGGSSQGPSGPPPASSSGPGPYPQAGQPPAGSPYSGQPWPQGQPYQQPPAQAGPAGPPGPSGPGLPPYGQGYSGQPYAKRSKAPLFIIVGLVVAALVAGVLVFFVAGGDDDVSAETPREAAEAFVDGANDRNEDKVRDVLCQEDRDAPAEDNPSDFDSVPPGLDLELAGGEEERGDVTVFEANITGLGEDDGALPIPVIEEDGEFRVCYSSLDDAIGPLGG